MRMSLERIGTMKGAIPASNGRGDVIVEATYAPKKRVRLSRAVERTDGALTGLSSCV